MLDDCDLSNIRERRLVELKAAAASKSKVVRSYCDDGRVERVTVEKDLIMLMTNAPRLVIHFCKDTFRRCKIMSGHLQVKKNLAHF